MHKIYVAFVLLMMSLSVSYAQPVFEQRSLEEALNPDGTLKRGVQGSFKVEGYTMRTGKNGEPIFLPQLHSAASGAWDTQFGLPVPGIAGEVRALAIDRQGNVYVGGAFRAVGGISTVVNNIVQYNAQTNSWSALGTGANNGVSFAGLIGGVRALAVDGQGRVYVGGDFTRAGGVSANSVARFDPATNSWSTLGTGANNGVRGSVNTLAVDGQGRVYVGGDFTEAGGVSANNVARFDPATNSWSTLGTGANNGVRDTSFSEQVNALAIDGQGRVYVGGRFTRAGEVSASRVARFDPATNSWSTLGTGANNGVGGDETSFPGPSVSALAVDGQGRVYVGGRFTQAGGVSANSVARFDPATNSWSTLGTGVGFLLGSGGEVNALAIDRQGRVYVGGLFTQAGGVSASSVARFDPATNSWSTLGTGANNGVRGSVNTLAVDGQGRVYVGGDFTEAGEVSANNVARFDPATNSWSTLGTGANNGVRDTSFSEQVNALAIDGQGRVYVGGRFTRAGEVSASRVARFDPATNSWSTLGTGANNGVGGDETSFPGPSVSALAVDGQGRVYVGGRFTQAGGVSANSVARFDPATNSWSTLGTGVGFLLGSGGEVNALAIDRQGRVYVGGLFTQAGGVSASSVARFDPATNSWSTLGTGANNGVRGSVNTLAVDGQGRVYVGGRFAEAGGVSASSVARFNPATNSWSALGTGGGSGTNDIVRALAVDGQGRVYVGGLFTQAGGVSANSVARFDPATNSWSTLGTGANNGVTGLPIPGIPDLPLPPDFVLPGIVGALAVDGQGNVYVGGAFMRAGGVSANSVARFNPATNSWSALGTGSSNGVSGSRNPILPIPSVSALAVDGQGRVYVGGDFTEAGGVSARSVARFSPATNSWSTLGTGANNGVSGDETPLSGPSVSALAIDGQGRVYVGGRFTRAGEVSANRVARFDPTTNSWSALGTGANNGISGDETPFSGPSVSALAVDGQGRVFVGGFFTRAGGVSANNVARFDPATNSWSTLGAGANNGVSGSVNALAVDGQGLVYVGGDFTEAGGVSASRVARFDPQANSWSTLGTGANNGVGGITSTISVGVNTFAVDRQGRVYVGGNFTTAGDFISTYIARWNSAASRIEQISADVPRTFLLEQNYPNPFNPSTTIRYQLPVASEVKLEVYDVLGKKVATLVSERQAAGYYQYVWNANGLTSGVYFYRLQAGGFVETKKMMLVK